ncbi:MAG: UvrD-helicase domain-containing protein [Planctomycetota bacterium]
MVDPTPAQTEAIRAREQDVCVSAGAGSGKTFVLTERFVGLVEDGLRPESILTITFTEKAAREMSRRIGRALGAGQRGVEGGWISTIHGFCARVLREHALEAGVDPAFGVLSEVPAARLRHGAFLEAQRGFRLEQPGAYDALVGHVAWGRDRDGATSVRRRVFELYDQIRASGAEVLPPELVPPAQGPSFDAALDRLTAALEAYGHAVSAGPRTSQLARQARRIGALAGEVGEADVSRFDVKVYHALGDLVDAARGGGELGVELEALRAAAERAAGAYAEAPARELGRGLLDLLWRFHRAFSARKERQSLLDFNDLEARTRTLLRERVDVREALQRRFKALLVDEFQDTSRLQQELVDLIRTPGALFVVGDVKQSIYGFRAAEVRGMLGEQERIREQGGTLVELDRSFRTRPEVLDFVDDVFSACWAEPGSEVPHQRLEAGLAFPEKTAPSVELVIGRGESLERAREQEAAAVAGRLATLIEERRLVGTNPLRPESFERALRYGDCAVLLPATTAFRFYERAFRERGIPYTVASGRGFYANREVLDAVLLLRVVADAHADLAVVALLRSPVAGVSDDGLARLGLLRGHREPWFDVLARAAEAGLSELDLERARFAHELVLRLRELRGRERVRDLLEEALTLSGLWDGSLLRHEDPRGYANLHKLLGIVEDLEREGVSGPGEVAEVLEELRLSGAREAEANLASDDEDAVRLLTVHASKGLEWPLVVVGDLGRYAPSAREPILYDTETGCVLPNLRDPERPHKAITAWTHTELSEVSAARRREESKRLLYVALTRAQDHLLQAGAEGTSSRRSGDWLRWVRAPLAGVAREGDPAPRSFDAAAGGEVQVVPSRSGVAVRRCDVAEEREGPLVGARGPLAGAVPALDGRGRHALSHGHLPAWPEDAPEVAAEAERRVLAADAPLPELDSGASVYTVSEVLTWSRCPRRALFEHVLGEDDPWRPPSGGGGGDVPADALGVFVHELLASGVRPRPQLLARLEQLALPRWVPPHALEEGVDHALRLVQGFERSPLGQRAAAADEVRREPPFLVRVELAGGARVLLRGTPDLLFREGERWTLVDYKSGDLTALEVPARLESDRVQLQLYALALAEGGLELAEARVAYLAAEIDAAVPVGPDVRAETRALLADFVDARRALELPPRPGPLCARCPHTPHCPEGARAVEG